MIGSMVRCYLAPTLSLTLLLLPAAYAGASPWEAEEWRDSGNVMQLYVCGEEHTRASWCPALERDRLAYRITLYAETFGPPMPEAMAHWHRVVAAGDLNRIGPKDFDMIRHRAETLQDPLAMEALGYLIYHGIMTPRDIAEAYVWFAKAFTAGRAEAGPKKDAVWNQLVQENPVAAEWLLQQYSSRPPAAPSHSAADGIQELSDSAQCNADPDNKRCKDVVWGF